MNNVKPGDLARVMDLPGPRRLGVSDKIIRVTHLDIVAGVTAWRYEAPLVVTVDGDRVDGFTDDCLRPIRDPGDDAQDETLSWKPVPLPTILPEMIPAKEEA